MLYTLPWPRFELTTWVVIGTDCICSCKSNYHMITATTAPIDKFNIKHWANANVFPQLMTDKIFLWEKIDVQLNWLITVYLYHNLIRRSWPLSLICIYLFNQWLSPLNLRVRFYDHGEVYSIITLCDRNCHWVADACSVFT
jgi:hypothetical protein